MKINHVKKSEKPIEDRRSNDEKNANLMKKDAMKNDNLNEKLNSKLDVGTKGQNPYQFVRPCSPTTQPGCLFSGGCVGIPHRKS